MLANQIGGEVIHLEVTAWPIGAETEPTLNSRCCDADLNWHQPEPDFPGNILGTCGRCGAWYFLGQLPGEPGEVLVRLSVSDPLLSVSRSA